MKHDEAALHRTAWHGLVMALMLLVCVASAHAQGITLSARESIQSGNFLVGFATVGDSGSYEADFHTPDDDFNNVASDTGSVDGQAFGLPVVGDAHFLTNQVYVVRPDHMSFLGAALSTVSTPYGYVSVGANALSQLELEFVLDAPMSFNLAGMLTENVGGTVNGLTGRAQTLFKLSGASDNWLFSDAGIFEQQGVLDAGIWRINILADSRGNATANFRAELFLTPVPEPASWALLLAGLGGVVLRRGRQA